MASLTETLGASPEQCSFHSVSLRSDNTVTFSFQLYVSERLSDKVSKPQPFQFKNLDAHRAVTPNLFIQ